MTGSRAQVTGIEFLEALSEMENGGIFRNDRVIKYYLETRIFEYPSIFTMPQSVLEMSGVAEFIPVIVGKLKEIMRANLIISVRIVVAVIYDYAANSVGTHYSSALN